jgi:SAM-dependent methyltransferase
MSTDLEWEKWGVQDPYFSVLTNPKFRMGEMTAKAKEDFFRSGRSHVARVLSACRKYIDPDFAPQRVLDFGCGVGRLVLPFAASAREVIGVDISDAMLNEARRNCAERGVTNATFVKSDDALSAVEGRFDLVHTAIVLQHIEAQRGTRIVAQLLTRMAPDGIAAIQVTYGKAYHAATLGVPPPAQPRQGPTMVIAAAKSTPWVRKLFGRRPIGTTPKTAPEPQAPDATDADASVANASTQDPEMQMNPYNLNALFYLMQMAGVTNFQIEFTDHGGELGVFLYFRKHSLQSG